MDREIKVIGFPPAFVLASFDPATLALKVSTHKEIIHL